MDVRRLAPILTVAALILGAAFALDLLIGFTAGGYVVPQQRPIPEADSIDAQLRSAGLKAAYQSGSIKPTEKVLVHVGTSAFWRALDPDILTNELGSGYRHALIYGRGGSLANIAQLTEPLLNSNIRPEGIVLYISPSMLGGRPPGEPINLDLAKTVRSLDGTDMVALLEQSLWLGRYRSYVQYFLQQQLATLRTTMRSAIGLSATKQPIRDPWTRRPIRDFDAPVGTASQWNQWTYWEENGFFDATRYRQQQSEQMAFLCDVIKRANGMGSRVIVVLIPLKARLRQSLPAELWKTIPAEIDKCKGNANVTIIDMSDSVSDEAFADYIHVTSAGRTVFSKELATRLQARLKD